MLNGRKRLIAAACSILATVAVLGLVPGSASAEPDVDDVKAQVNRLYHEAEQASERYNDARLELKELKRDLGSLKADERRQDAQLSAVREQVRDSVVRQYEGQGMSAVGQVVVSEDPQAFLDQLSTMSAFNDLQSQLFDDYSRELKALDIRHDATAERLAEMAKTKQQLADEKATIDDKLAQAKELLGRLQAAAAPAPAPTTSTSRSSTVRYADVPVSGRAGVAVQYALDQVGDAYVYGATGPDAYDCSGLTMAAWGAAGVSLPHSSSAQYSSGPQVAASDLQPGDLVFYYQPISHVGIYIGNGQIVHAANPSTGVQVTGLYTMPFSGAVRPG